jgi:hypothetical protein
MEWLKTILEGRGIEVTEELLSDVSKEIPKHFIPKSEYNRKNDEVKTLQRKIDEAPDASKLSEQLTALQAKYDTDTASLNDKIGAIEKDYALSDALTKSGARSAKAVKALLDDSKIEFKDGVLSGVDEQIDGLKNEYGYLFEGTRDTGFALGGSGEAAEDSFINAVRNGAGLGKRDA